MQEFPEEPGYRVQPGFVKGNPLNNDLYVERCCEVMPGYADNIRTRHAALTYLVPGYNISQIKEKFGDLRFYVSIPSHFPEDVKEEARSIANA